MSVSANVLAVFGFDASLVAVKSLGEGLINHTYIVEYENDFYVLQKINTTVFKNPVAIAHNIQLIAGYLASNNPNYHFVAPTSSVHGNQMEFIEEGYYRVFPYVKGSHAKTVVQNEDQAYEAGYQFGLFTNALNGLDANDLQITIPDFHNLTLRYAQFELALTSGNQDRIAASKNEIQFLKDHSWIADFFETIKANPNFKLRATHHDTKISNLLFDEHDKGICVIDLDTLMPGYFISDLGDMFRTYLCAVSEEETDFSKLVVRPTIYKAIVKGYLKGAGNMLSKDEADQIYYAGLFMIYMQALRFLTDFINDDVYYGAKYPLHNFNRASNQIKLLEDYLQKKEILEIEINN
ncbi:MAG: phosphotransferase enzyme family protein [Bacteroidota bacterium]|jgi:Ser/Thr protein kinase RdoA (MazF antagonist)